MSVGDCLRSQTLQLPPGFQCAFDIIQMKCLRNRSNTTRRHSEESNTSRQVDAIGNKNPEGCMQHVQCIQCVPRNGTGLPIGILDGRVYMRNVRSDDHGHAFSLDIPIFLFCHSSLHW